MRLLVLCAALVLSACASLSGQGGGAPAASHHQHLVSPSTALLWEAAPLDSEALVRQLDEAGIRRGVVLSAAYVWADESRAIDDPDGRVQEENDWTSVQVSRHPDRLTGFCSVNPLRPGALAEIERCLDLPGMEGLKLHFGDSGVNLRDPEHLARTRQVFETANRLGAPIAVHLRPRDAESFGRAESEIFLDRLLPAAPDVVMQVAHLGGSGHGFPEDARQAFAPLAEAVEADDPRARNLYFDVAGVANEGMTPVDGAAIAAALRRVGMERILFGAGASTGGDPEPWSAWVLFRRLPLTREEFTTVAANVAPYLR